jgi:hypothetical protein
MNENHPPAGIHIKGSTKGEELAKKKGREPGRSADDKRGYRSARDSTSISPEDRDPIDPRMPYMPPA